LVALPPRVPELPETETIARDLDGALRGAVVRSVRVLRNDVLRDAQHGGQALRGHQAERAAKELEQRLTSATVTQIFRRAKSIVLEFGLAGRLAVTPRFTGALLIDPPPDDPYVCLVAELSDDRRLSYRDVRRLGTITLLDEPRYVAWNAALGPEPLDPELTAERFSGILRGSERAVKSILMDQRRLAGVGNIYANEACWRAGVRPSRRARSLTRAESAALLSSVRNVLTESIALRGTTFRDFQDAYGARGGFAAKLAVYGRGGLPCRRCGAVLRESHRIEGRTTVWCHACQR
jgi:formamidopyrimidine-DNA glycosylase